MHQHEFPALLRSQYYYQNTLSDCNSGNEITVRAAWTLAGVYGDAKLVCGELDAI
jgi:hypothetical protein